MTFLLALLVFAFPFSAFAYLDPGSISFFLQVSAAFLFGIILNVKLFGRKFFDRFKGSRLKKEESQDSTEDISQE